jgi:hypothetical protein
MKSIANNLTRHLSRAGLVILSLGLSSCMQAQPAPSLPNQRSSEVIPSQQTVSSSTSIQTTPSLVIDEKRMVDDMMTKIRRFLTEKPQTAEEVMAIFELTEARKTTFPTGETSILTYGKFPLTQVKFVPSNSASRFNGQIDIGKDQRIFSFGLYFYDASTRFQGIKDELPKGAPWCFPSKELLSMLKEFNFEPKRWDNQKTTHLTYLRLKSKGEYEEIVFQETPDRGSCLKKFIYGPSASLTHIKM